ncbi:MAG: hypothetical protein M1817_006700 [Caeruleum heppii]|nr:MAG: hypothetical protein M1817_006700 [Caeruleum heppii]
MAPSSPKIPLLLLKTPSSPTDAYADYFRSFYMDLGSSHVGFEPQFVPVLEHRFRDDGLGRLTTLVEGGAFRDGGSEEEEQRSREDIGSGDETDHLSEDDFVHVERPNSNPSDARLDDELAPYVSEKKENMFECLVPDCSKLWKSKHHWKMHVERRHAEWLAGLKDGESDGKAQRQTSPQYGGIILTSQRAVEALLLTLRSTSPSPSLSALVPTELPLYVVGPATYRALLAPFPFSSASTNPINPDQIHGSHTGNGAALADFIKSHYPTLSTSHYVAKGESTRKRLKPLLFLVGEQRRDIIPKTLMAPELPEEARIGVDELVVYETGLLPSFGEDIKQVLQDLNTQPDASPSTRLPLSSPAPPTLPEISNITLTPNPNLPIYILIFSPTGIRELLHVLRHPSATPSSCPTAPPRNCSIVTIGPTTCDFVMENFGVRPAAVADAPSPEGVARAIERFERFERWERLGGEEGL